MNYYWNNQNGNIIFDVSRVVLFEQQVGLKSTYIAFIRLWYTSTQNQEKKLNELQKVKRKAFPPKKRLEMETDENSNILPFNKQFRGWNGSNRWNELLLGKVNKCNWIYFTPWIFVYLHAKIIWYLLCTRTHLLFFYLLLCTHFICLVNREKNVENNTGK